MNIKLLLNNFKFLNELITLNNVFNRIYAQQEKMIMTNIRNKMTPEERKEAEELDKRMAQYNKDAEKIKEDLKSRKY